jgi:hypothetical protein
MPAGHALAENSAGGSDAQLAQELTNPVADLITIPVQMTWDRNIGVRDDGWRIQTNIQPVIPFELNADWNLITRTILPVICQDDIAPRAGSQFGLGDLSLSLFFSPRKPGPGGFVVGVGPILMMPTATDDQLGTEKWSAGPAAVALTMRGPWTMGMLANQVWSYAGDSDRSDVNYTFVQPFLAFSTPSAYTLSLQAESIYDWEAEKWSIPVTAALAKLVRWGKLPVSLSAGVGYWAESPNSGPEGFRFRLQANFVLPKSR